MHSRVLIANRGEIAIRIRRALHAMGAEAVAVHAAIDANSLHIRGCDAVRTLPGAGIAPYLDAEAIIEAARETGCQAIHPGYGFLAENAAFARACDTAGLTFVGPSPEVLALFGDKTRALTLARELGIPVIPGSDGVLDNAAAAIEAAARIGYPVMLKAAAGGGGRGMRVVSDAAGMADAFARAGSEAAAAFGDGSLFLERRIERPRHIEIQILADTQGNCVHLFERDCSVQRRHQKVVEIAPAVGLDTPVREKLREDALRLVRAAGFTNAGTVEFLVVPETGEYYFIECNPRIQVEHTVTEQITGIDLVQAQLAISAGATLADLGLADQNAVGSPRGAAIQVRVVATGGGTLTAYREPTGAGVRVDASAYQGYAPPLAVDPLFAKVIGTCTTRAATERDALAAAIGNARQALDEYVLEGLPNNRAELAAILADAVLATGDARTSFLDERPELAATGANASALSRFLAAQASPAGSAPQRAPEPDHLAVPDGHAGVVSPMDGNVLERLVSVGEFVNEGDTLLVINAMKMETLIAAPVSGRLTALVEPTADNAVRARQIVAVIAPTDNAVAATATSPAQATWQDVLDDVAQLQGIAHARLAPGSDDPGVVRQRNRGKLTCRERIDRLLDAGSFREVGSLAGFASYEDGAISAFTPANHVGGWGTIQDRTAIVCADDFTSRGGHADGAIGAKSMHLDRLALELRVPSVRLLDGSSGGGSVAAMVPEQKKAGEKAAQESSGAITAGRPRVSGGGGSFLPPHLGSSFYAQQLGVIPVVNVLLGSVVGIGAAKAVLGHFGVMVRDIAQLFVAGPPVVSHAMGYDVTKEDLGGWHIHCTNGSVDNLAESEEEALDMTRRFLSYLPANVYEAPPVIAAARKDGPDRRDEALATIIPRKRTTTYDVRRVIRLLVDEGSFFEIGALWGTDQVAGLARVNGHPIGVIASDSQHVNGGALTADGCSKLTRHLDLCDLFHLPILNLVDNPGFAVGIEHEMNGTIRRGGEWMVAFAQTTVPLFTVIMRRSFGVAGNNYATPRSHPSMRVVWPSADVGGIPPEGGIEAAYKRQLAEAADPVAFRAELMARIESARGPIGPLNRFQMEEMIDPRDTRRYICDWATLAYRTQGERLKPRELGFRP
ncbi:MAG: ATP-grasp domain-containing protein [Pseudomonadales bacterium]|nr:ATP-grasp domain-containing protein [Pseudomonadales bacterium]